MKRWILEEADNGWLLKDTATITQHQHVFLTIDELCAHLIQVVDPDRPPGPLQRARTKNAEKQARFRARRAASEK